MAAAASASAFSKLSAPLRHHLLRQSAVTLAGKLAGERALPVFAPYQKPVFAGNDIGSVNMMLFGRVDSPVTRSASELLMKKKDDDLSDSVPLEDDDEDSEDSDEDFDDEFEDFDDIDDDCDDVDVSEEE